MTVPVPNIAIYTEDLVVTPATLASLKRWAETQPEKDRDRYLRDLGNANQASDIATAGFDTIIVGLFHVHEGGLIFYNGFPVNTETFPDICKSIAALKSSPGSTVKTIILSFGGGAYEGGSVSDADYTNMKASWPAFKSDLLVLLEHSASDGVDWDYEPVATSFDTGFIIQITNEMAASPYLATAAPYTDQDKWITVIEGTRTGSSGNNFAWWNLQCYGGADYGGWVTALQGASTGLSAAAVEAFLLPGYDPGDCLQIPGVVSMVQTLHGGYPSLNGAFIWFYTPIKDCAQKAAGELRSIFD